MPRWIPSTIVGLMTLGWGFLGVAHSAEKVVLLRNGNVLHGNVSRRAAQVMISSGMATIQVAKGEVDLIAESLDDAYQQQTARLAPHQTDGRANLIRWCLREGLRSQALVELGVLQRHDPRHPQLKLLESQIVEHRTDWSGTSLPDPHPLHPDRQFAVVHQGDLAEPTLAEFTKVVQPLLLNRCGQAACHGNTTTTRFQLTNSPYANIPRGITERNLGGVLSQIKDGQSAEFTLLAMSAVAPHGGAKGAPLNEPQSRLLLDWVSRARREAFGATSDDAAVASESHPDASNASAPSQTNATRRPRKGIAHAGGHESDSQKSRAGGVSTAMFVVDPHADPFSPDAFNAKFHLCPPALESDEP